MTTLVDVVIALVKIAGIPRVADITRMVRKIKQEINFALRIRSDNFQNIIDVAVIHRDDVVEIHIVARANLPRIMLLERNFHGFQLIAGAVMDADVAHFVKTLGGGRIYIKLLRQTLLGDHLLKNKLRHRRPTNIPQTYKQNFDHYTAITLSVHNSHCVITV